MPFAISARIPLLVSISQDWMVSPLLRLCDFMMSMWVVPCSDFSNKTRDTVSTFEHMVYATRIKNENTSSLWAVPPFDRTFRNLCYSALKEKITVKFRYIFIQLPRKKAVPFGRFSFSTILWFGHSFQKWILCSRDQTSLKICYISFGSHSLFGRWGSTYEAVYTGSGCSLVISAWIQTISMSYQKVLECKVEKTTSASFISGNFVERRSLEDSQTWW